MREVEYEFFNHDTTRRNKRAGFFGWGGANLDFIKRLSGVERELETIKNSINFGKNQYRSVEHFNAEQNYYVFDDGFICVKNGIAIVQFNYVIAKEPVFEYNKVAVLDNLPIPYNGIPHWFGACAADSPHSINIYVNEHGTMLIYGGETNSGYRISFSYPCQ